MKIKNSVNKAKKVTSVVPVSDKGTQSTGKSLRSLWEKKYMTVEEVAEYMQISKMSVYGLFKKNRLVMYSIGVGRGTLCLRTDVKRVFKELERLKK